jgi:hypothetical protein
VNHDRLACRVLGLKQQLPLPRPKRGKNPSLGGGIPISGERQLARGERGGKRGGVGHFSFGDCRQTEMRRQRKRQSVHRFLSRHPSPTLACAVAYHRTAEVAVFFLGGTRLACREGFSPCIFFFCFYIVACCSAFCGGHKSTGLALRRRHPPPPPFSPFFGGRLTKHGRAHLEGQRQMVGLRVGVLIVAFGRRAQDETVHLTIGVEVDPDVGADVGCLPDHQDPRETFL